MVYQNFEKYSNRLNGFPNNTLVIHNFANFVRLNNPYMVLKSKLRYYEKLNLNFLSMPYLDYSKLTNHFPVFDLVIASDVPFTDVKDYVGEVSFSITNLYNIHSGVRFLPSDNKVMISDKTEYDVFTNAKEFVIFDSEEKIVDVLTSGWSVYKQGSFYLFVKSGKSGMINISTSSGNAEMFEILTFGNDFNLTEH